MKAARKRRLLIMLVLVVGVGAALALTLAALRENINLFYSPSQVHAGEVADDAYFRIGGMVVNGSVARSAQTLEVSFDLTDTAHTVNVRYSGILPDLFREGQGIVAQGRLRDGVFVADQVLAKHDETYMPPEVHQALRDAGRNAGGADAAGDSANAAPDGGDGY